MKYYFQLFLVWSVFLFFSIENTQAQRKRRVERERSPQQELQYDNINYLPGIRSVVWQQQGLEGSFPVIYLGEGNMLELSFDDLRGDVRNYYYSVEHCTADWKSSHLSPLEYAEGYNEDRIDNFSPSVNTLQGYTNYKLTIPSREVRPKRSGNYLLKVYEDADKKRLILTRRFYVVQPHFDIAARIQPSTDNSKRSKNQKLDLTLNTAGITVNNPYQDVQVLALQNQRPDVQQWLRKPSFVNGSELRYEDRTTLDFEGGNEFRYVDLRSLRLASERIAQLYTDSLVHAQLTPDLDLSTLAYGTLYDENGAFFLRNEDRPNALEESDYAQVTFSLNISSPDQYQGAGIYVVGAFNNYERKEENKLQIQENSELWQTTLPLRQGLYDYDYVVVSALGEVKPFALSGSYFQTGNDYQILVYYRRPGTTWDEIWGFYEIKTSGN